MIGIRPVLTPGWWWWGGGGSCGWIKWLGPGWSCEGGWEPGGGPCQTPPPPGESTRPGWNPLGSTFDLKNNMIKSNKKRTNIPTDFEF